MDTNSATHIQHDKDIRKNKFNEEIIHKEYNNFLVLLTHVFVRHMERKDRVVG